MGEIECRIIERIKDHSGGDHTSHMMKLNVKTSNTDVRPGNLKVSYKEFSNNKRKRKIFWFFMDQRPKQLYGENQSLWSSLIKQIITNIATNKLCRIEIIILIVYNPLPC